MDALRRFKDLHGEITRWRRDLHAHPEILFETPRTSALIAERLREFGCDEVATGVGHTGVVGVLKGAETTSGKVVALRADIDALPIQEATGLPYASTIPGAMHACGHDGHTAMLLGAAKHLAETRDFDGSVILVFQPAEEGGGGGREMCEDGLMTRWDVQEIYGMHTWPGRPVGAFATRAGAFFASIDTFDITLIGRGGHAAYPHLAIDPLAMAADLIAQTQKIVSRETDPMTPAVVSITSLQTASDAYNVISDRVFLKGTVRTFDPALRARIEERLRTLSRAISEGAGGDFALRYDQLYPVATTTQEQTDVVVRVAKELTGDCEDAPKFTGGDDFAFMAMERPAGYVMIGNGDGPAVHHPAYDFNDAAIPSGCAFWTRLVETRMPRNARL